MLLHGRPHLGERIGDCRQALQRLYILAHTRIARTIVEVCAPLAGVTAAFTPSTQLICFGFCFQSLQRTVWFCKTITNAMCCVYVVIDPVAVNLIKAAAPPAAEYVSFTTRISILAQTQPQIQSHM